MTLGTYAMKEINVHTMRSLTSYEGVDRFYFGHVPIGYNIDNQYKLISTIVSQSQYE